MKTKYNLATFIEAKRKADSIEIDLADGTSVLLPPPVLWSEEARALLGKRGANKRKLVDLLLGEADAARFVAEGGSYDLLDAIYLDAQGADVGESSASS